MQTLSALKRAGRRSAVFLTVGTLALSAFAAPAVVAQSGPSVTDSRTTVELAKSDRLRAEARVAELESLQVEIRDRIADASAETNAIAAEIAEARREAMRRAIDAYVTAHDSNQLALMLQSDDVEDAAARTSYLSGQTRAAVEAAVALQKLKEENDPAVVALAVELDEATRRLEDARNDLIQASALEADAERTLTEALDRSDDAEASSKSRRPAAPAGPTPTVPPEPEPAPVVVPPEPVAVPAVVAPAPRYDSVFGDMAPKFEKLRQCESSGNYHIVSASGRYRGAYQFDRTTWESVGGVGDPAAASPAEQDLRAWILYQRRGSRPWPHCGQYLR